MARPFFLFLAILAIPLTASAQDPDQSLALLKILFHAVKDRNWASAVAALLVLFVGLVRFYGKKLHELIPDDHWADAIFWFLLDTKPGGWVLNFLTAIAGALGTALLAGEEITWDLVMPTITVSLSGAAIWGAFKDTRDWWEDRKKAKAISPVAPPAA